MFPSLFPALSLSLTLPQFLWAFLLVRKFSRRKFKILKENSQQPDFTQIYDLSRLWRERSRQDFDKLDILPVEMCFSRATTTLTLLDGTFTDLLKLTKRAETITTPVTTMTIPLIRDTYDTISWIPQP